jgi:hypothetical protein
MKSPILIAIPVLLSFAVEAIGQSDSWREELKPYLSTHCLDCHQGDEPEAGLDLTKLPFDLNDLEVTRRWTQIHDRISKGEMPPKDAPRPQPKENSATLTRIAKAISAADRSRSDVVLRRLNRVEYENTVRTLFGAKVRVKQALPADTSTDGFDNVGEGLAISAEAMQAYLRAAEITLDAVFGSPKAPKQIDMKTNLIDQKTHDGKPQLTRQLGAMFRKTEKGIAIFQSGYCPSNIVNFARLRAPAGTYRVTIEARAIQSDVPVTLRVYAGDTIVNRRERHLAGYFDVPVDEWTTIEFEDELVESGGTFQPKCYNTRDIRKGADTYEGAGIELGDIRIVGPLEEWPPPSRSRLLGDIDPAAGTIEDIRTIVKRILPQAFRRKVDPDEESDYIQIAQTALDQDRTFIDALRLSLKAVICSPDFLFLDEATADSDSNDSSTKLSQFAIANRLSYFLWSTMPDEQLLGAARKGQLSDTRVLRRQVERMLVDEKASAFIENFAGQWLELREIDFTEPDKDLYPEYDELLRVTMIEETKRFLHEILKEDLSVTNFIDSDFTYLNERLARHYGMTNVIGQEVRRVTLPKESVRGGLLTQASILKITANGTNTSPVLRGTWVLEKLLGHHVPPPPSNVAAVEPDIRGATTIRQQLKKHRSDASCASCHNTIDPPGFALESFDPIGGWRDRYRTVGEGERPKFGQAPFTYAWVRYRLGLPVDATGETVDGEAFDDIRKFKQLLLRDKPQIARGIAEKLFVYAIGRRLNFSDRSAIDKIVEHSRTSGYGFRELIHQVVLSEPFSQP